MGFPLSQATLANCWLFLYFTLLRFVKTVEDTIISVQHQLFKVSEEYYSSSHLMRLHQALTSSKQSSTCLEIFDLSVCNLPKTLMA
jgi:hypothetical protein